MTKKSNLNPKYKELNVLAKSISKCNVALTQKKFSEIKVGDVVIVFDEYSHDYLQHRIKVEGLEYDKENVTESNPKGMVCYGTDLDEEEWGDDYITMVSESNFCRVSDQC